MNTITETETNLQDLTPGTRILMPATLNSVARLGTVVSVEPWILTAGPKAGEQAREGRSRTSAPLWTVTLDQLETVGPALKCQDDEDRRTEVRGTMRMAVTEQRTRMVLA